MISLIPQFIVVALLFGGVCISLTRHGEAKEEKYNVWYSLLSAAIWIALLIWGGFFKL